MSSADVRQAINDAVTAAAAPTPVFDLSDYVSIDDALGTVDSEAVLIQYVAADEAVASIGGENNLGWEESGSVTLHYVVPTGFTSAPIVNKSDALRNAIKGKRLTNQITVESCPPFVDFGLSPGREGAWHSWLTNLFYVKRVCGSA